MAAVTAISRLNRLRQVAAIKWQLPSITNQLLIDWGRIGGHSVRHITEDSPQQFHYGNVGALCWVFGCQVSDLLTIVPVAKVEQASQPPSSREIAALIKRIHPRPPSGPRPPDAVLVNKIPEILRGLSADERAKIHMHRATLHFIMRPNQGDTRIAREHLAVLVTDLGIPLDDLLIAPRRDDEQPTPSESQPITQDV